MRGLFRHTRLESRHNAGLIKKKVTHMVSGNGKEDGQRKQTTKIASQLVKNNQQIAR